MHGTKGPEVCSERVLLGSFAEGFCEDKLHNMNLGGSPNRPNPFLGVQWCFSSFRISWTAQVAVLVEGYSCHAKCTL